MDDSTLDDVQFHAYMFLLVFAMLHNDLDEELSPNLMLKIAFDSLLRRFNDIKEKVFRSTTFVMLPEKRMKPSLKAAEAKVHFVNFAVFISMVCQDTALEEAIDAFFTTVFPRNFDFTPNMLTGYIDLRTRNMVKKMSELREAFNHDETEVDGLIQKAFPPNPSGYNLDSNHPVSKSLLSVVEKRLEEVSACHDIGTLQAQYSKDTINQKWKASVREVLEREFVIAELNAPESMIQKGTTSTSRSLETGLSPKQHYNEADTKPGVAGRLKCDQEKSSTENTDTDKRQSNVVPARNVLQDQGQKVSGPNTPSNRLNTARSNRTSIKALASSSSMAKRRHDIMNANELNGATEKSARKRGRLSRKTAVKKQPKVIPASTVPLEEHEEVSVQILPTDKPISTRLRQAAARGLSTSSSAVKRRYTEVGATEVSDETEEPKRKRGQSSAAIVDSVQPNRVPESAHEHIHIQEQNQVATVLITSLDKPCWVDSSQTSAVSSDADPFIKQEMEEPEEITRPSKKPVRTQ